MRHVYRERVYLTSAFAALEIANARRKIIFKIQKGVK